MSYKAGDWVQVKKELDEDCVSADAMGLNPEMKELAGHRFKVKSIWKYEWRRGRNREETEAYSLEGNDYAWGAEWLEPAEIRIGDKVHVKPLADVLEVMGEKEVNPQVSYPIGEYCDGFYLVDDVPFEGYRTLLGVGTPGCDPFWWPTDALELVVPQEQMKSPIKVKVCKKESKKPVKVKVRRIEKNEKHDMVNHPTHYTSGGIECIDAMESAFGEEAVYWFCVCNAFKYVWRHSKKNNREDLEKARWYINRALRE